MDRMEQGRNLYAFRRLKHTAERAMLVFICTCALGILALLYVQNRALNTEISNQQAAVISRQKSLAKLTRQLTQETNEINQHVQCIGDFFAQPDRQNLSISNIQQCTFNTNAFSPTVAVVPKPTSVPAAKEPTTSAPPNNPTPTPATPQTGSPSATGTSTGTSNPTTPSQPSFLDRLTGGVLSTVKSLL